MQQEKLKVGPSGLSRTSKALANERSNSLLLRTTPDLMEGLKVLVAALDRMVSPPAEATESASQGSPARARRPRAAPRPAGWMPGRDESLRAGLGAPGPQVP